MPFVVSRLLGLAALLTALILGGCSLYPTGYYGAYDEGYYAPGYAYDPGFGFGYDGFDEGFGAFDGGFGDFY